MRHSDTETDRNFGDTQNTLSTLKHLFNGTAEEVDHIIREAQEEEEEKAFLIFVIWRDEPEENFRNLYHHGDRDERVGDLQT